MWRVALAFVTTLLNALPKLVELLRDWQREQAAAKDKATKDARNEAAIREAQKALDQPKP